MKVYSSVEQLIGNTPLLELVNIEKKISINARIFAKLEALNPAGSAKDRAAKWMLDDAEAKGIIKPGATIIEPTSGNTGIGLAAIGAARGYRVIIVMPDSMSKERILTMQAYGAEVVLTPGSEGMAAAIAKAEELHKSIADSFIPNQFENPANAKAHFDSTGKEIYQDLDGKVDIFIAGVGTGGTITGCGQYLKAQNENIKIIAVEPAASPLLSKGFAGPHDLQGIGANFIPKALDCDVYDEIITITDEEAYEAGRLMGSQMGFLVGITSGAVLAAAIKLGSKPENAGKNIVVLMPDTGSRYLSTKMFDR